jgi:hypothetical protein
MKRGILLATILSCVLLPAFCISVMPDSREMQPFDSETELAKIDFSQPLAQNQLEWVEQCTVSLVTVGPGDALYSWFGHSAMVVTQPNGKKVMYDYGIFDKNQKHFYLNFARGRMLYSVWASQADWRIDYTIATEDRDLTWIDLDLSPEATFATIRFLQNNAKEGNNTYLYHFYEDNCATRLRDIIDSATGGQFRTWAESQDAGGTFRSFAMRSLAHRPLVAWFLNFLQGPSIDRPLTRYDDLFLPESLNRAVLDFTYEDGTPLARSTTILNDTTGKGIRFVPSDTNVNLDLRFALVGLALGLASLLLHEKGKGRAWTAFNAVVLFVLASIGTLLLFMMTLSNMDMTWFNENIVAINPLLWIAFIRSLQGKADKLSGIYRKYSIAIVLLVVAKGILPALLVQDDIGILLTVLPFYLAGFLKDVPSAPGTGKTPGARQDPDGSLPAGQES